MAASNGSTSSAASPSPREARRVSLIGALAGLATGMVLFSLLCVANFIFQSGAAGGDEDTSVTRALLVYDLVGLVVTLLMLAASALIWSGLRRIWRPTRGLALCCGLVAGAAVTGTAVASAGPAPPGILLQYTAIGGAIGAIVWLVVWLSTRYGFARLQALNPASGQDENRL